MDRPVAVDLEFDKVLELIAAHARTGVARVVIERLVGPIEGRQSALDLALLTRAALRLLEEDGPIALAGVDEAAAWLEPGSIPPADPRDLLSLLTLARRIASVRRRLAAADEDVFRALVDELPDTSALVAEVAPKLSRDGSVPDGASPELARLRRGMIRLRTEVLAEIEAIRRSHPDEVTDAPPTMRRDRYCLPVRSSARARLPGLLLDTSSRGATAFVEPFAVVELNNRLTEAVSAERDEIRRILLAVARAFAEAHDDLAAALEVLGKIDAAQAKALFGRAVEGRIVIPGEGTELILRGARHPLLDERLHGLRAEVFGDVERRKPEYRVVPLDFRMPEKVRTLVISGPNAGGKTVVLKTLGLMVLMSGCGVPLPVEEGTAVPHFDRLWCHVGDEQDVAADLSTFSGAMAATARLLEEADRNTLVLFDELGAGTDPLEGAALGCALLEELTRRECLTVASTHLAAIALSATAAESMDNAAMDYDEASARPTYTLSMGRPGRSRGLEIAQKMGVAESVLERASDLLGGDHLELDRWLRRLETVEQELEAERAEVRRREREAETLRDEAALELTRLEAERRKVPEELAEERELLRRRAKRRLDDVIGQLEKAREERETLGRRRLQKLRDEALRLEAPATESPCGSGDELIEGAEVRLALGGEGILREVRGSRALVAVGGKRLWVPTSELEIVPGRSRPARTAKVEIETTDLQPGELNLIGLDSERARAELERHLDRAFAAGTPRFRVVHGHGAGILRKMVAEVCRSHPAVLSFRHPPRNRGGTGATEIELEEGG
ncbi:MAG: Smr/MutS family protein [Thermoanaerobaculales bacterium]